MYNVTLSPIFYANVTLVLGSAKSLRYLQQLKELKAIPLISCN